jgi:drug/metabolite transporter (DMT)-like permease
MPPVAVTPRQAATAYLLLTLTVLFWAGNAVLARLLHADIGPVSLAFGRWALATLLLLPLAWPHLRRQRRELLRAWPVVAVLALLGVSSFNTLLYQAAHTTSSNNIALIQTVMPAMIVLLAGLLFGERVTGIAVLGVCLSMLGAMLVVFRGDLQVLMQWQFTPGDLWMLLATFVYALYSVLLRRRPAVHPLALLAATFLVGSLALLPLSAWELRHHGPPVPSGILLGGLVYLAVFPSILSYLFWNRGVALVGASRAGFFICLIPVFTAALAAGLLDERLAWFHLVGLALIVSGFVVFQRR